MDSIFIDDILSVTVYSILAMVTFLPMHAGSDSDTLKRRGASQGSSEKKGVLGHYLPFFVNFTLKYDKFSNKKEG